MQKNLYQRNLFIFIFYCCLQRTYTASALPRMCYNKHAVLVPMNGSCNGFYICVHGNAIASSCGSYYHFNGKLGICDDPKNVDCSVVNVDLNNLSEPTKPQILKGNISDPDVGNLCKNQTNGKIFPNFDSCHQYYVCFNETAFSRSCPRLMHFNDALGLCQDPSLAGCTSVADERMVSNEYCENLTSTLTWAHDTDCQRYYGCSRKRIVEYVCPEGLYYSEKKQRCEWPWNVDCSQAPN